MTYDYGTLRAHLITARTCDRLGRYWKEHGKGVRAWVRAALTYWAHTRAEHARLLPCTVPAWQARGDVARRRHLVNRARALRMGAPCFRSLTGRVFNDTPGRYPPKLGA